MAKLVSPDKGKSVEWYLKEKVTGWQQEVATQLHALVLEVCPEASHTIKWAQPVYDSPEGPMAFMKGAKNHVTFGFWRGSEMDDPAGVFEGKGDKMRHIKVKSPEALDKELIGGFIRQAIALNADKGDPTKKA